MWTQISTIDYKDQIPTSRYFLMQRSYSFCFAGEISRFYLCAVNKFFAVILLLLVSVATFTPCCLFDDCANEQPLTRKDTKEKSEGACSPFFSCSTCSGFTWTPTTIQLPEPPAKKITHYERVFTDHIQVVYTSFWQPPRAA